MALIIKNSNTFDPLRQCVFCKNTENVNKTKAVWDATHETRAHKTFLNNQVALVCKFLENAEEVQKISERYFQDFKRLSAISLSCIIYDILLNPRGLGEITLISGLGIGISAYSSILAFQKADRLAKRAKALFEATSSFPQAQLLFESRFKKIGVQNAQFRDSLLESALFTSATLTTLGGARSAVHLCNYISRISQENYS